MAKSLAGLIVLGRPFGLSCAPAALDQACPQQLVGLPPARQPGHHRRCQRRPRPRLLIRADERADQVSCGESELGQALRRRRVLVHDRLHAPPPGSPTWIRLVTLSRFSRIASG